MTQNMGVENMLQMHIVLTRKQPMNYCSLAFLQTLLSNWKNIHNAQ